MHSLRVQNFRGFIDSGSLEFKPLTLFLGSNSSGKSTFLRVFPLLQQTLSRNSNNSIKWNGNLVDFGSFEEVINNQTNDDFVVFEYKFILHSFKNIKSTDNTILEIDCASNKNTTLKLKYKQINGLTSVTEVEIFVFDFILYLLFDYEKHYCKVKIENNGEISEINPIAFELNNQIIPTLNLNPKKHEEIEYSLLTISNLLKSLYSYAAPQDVLQSGRLTESSSNISIILDSSRSMTRKILTSVRRDLKFPERDIKLITNIHIAIGLPDIINQINTYLSNAFINCTYVAPIRAHAERYYRSDIKSGDNIDHFGRDLHEYLYTISRNEKLINSLNEWLTNFFHFTIHVLERLNHISIHLKFDQEIKNSYNLIDVGFGYTQLLPIAVNLWKASHSSDISYSRDKNPLIILIEQPELHLHPHLQSSFIKALAEVINTLQSKDIDLKIILETHSEYFINKLGHLIYEKDLDKDLLGIYIFNNQSPGISNIHQVFFQEDGTLDEWPLGFFDIV